MKIKRGTSIIEIVIAAAMISMAVIAALSLSNNSQKQNTYARSLAEANKFTSQAADWIRQERTLLGWSSLAVKNDGVYCLNDFPSDFSELIPGSCDPTSFIPSTLPSNYFKRELALSKPTSTSLSFIITVTWEENTTRQTSLEMELTEW